MALAKELDDLGTYYQNKVPLTVLYDRMKAVGELVEESQSKGGRSAGKFSNIYARFHGALENAVQQQVPGAETLQQAIHASRQEHAVKRLQKITGKIWGKDVASPRRQTTGYTLSVARTCSTSLSGALADDEVFKGSFTADEIADMRQFFQSANELPNLPVPGSVAKGAGQWAARSGIGGRHWLCLCGNRKGGGWGVYCGAAPEIISKAMTHPRGRAVSQNCTGRTWRIASRDAGGINEAIREVPETYTSKRSTSSAP